MHLIFVVVYLMKKHGFITKMNHWSLHLPYSLAYLLLNEMEMLIFKTITIVTLALGSQPRQGFVRMRAKRRAWECGRVWEWTLTLPNELPFWELKFRWAPETSESDYKGRNPSSWGVLYIIRNLLKFRCPKWARMTHLDICNTSYG